MYQKKHLGAIVLLKALYKHELNCETSICHGDCNDPEMLFTAVTFFFVSLKIPVPADAASMPIFVVHTSARIATV